MNVLILGSGGREHAIAWKIAQSSSCNKLFIAPGNAGTAEIGENLILDILDFKKIKYYVMEKKIEMVIVGPEGPLVAGIYDFFKNDVDLSNISLIGPSKLGARLEGSKEFAKEFMIRNGIPTAKYQSFTKKSINNGYKFLESLNPPYVLKADGLAAGKGVLIIDDLIEAKKQLNSMLNEESFGAASSTAAFFMARRFMGAIRCVCITTVTLT